MTLTIDKWGNRIAYPTVSREEFDALRRDVEELKALILQQRDKQQPTAPR